MRSLIGKVVFQIGDTEYRWEDVLLSAIHRGEWRGVVDRARAGLALYQEASEADELPVSDDEIETSAGEFRYAQNLVTAEETEAWLEAWGLTVDEWMQWVVSDLLLARHEGEPPELSEETSPEEIEAATHAEAVCSGRLGRFSYDLASRAAVAQKLGEEAGASSGADAEEPSGGAGEDADLGELPFDLPDEEVRRRLGHVAKLERTFQRFRSQAVTPAAVAARIKAHLTDWAKVTVRVLRLESEDAAREAHISIRDDGAEWDEVAADSGAELQEGVFLLESFEPAVRDHLLAAQKGDLVGPVADGETWLLVSVLDKRLPSPGDEEVAVRAEWSVLLGAVAREVDNRITWRWRK